MRTLEQIAVAAAKQKVAFKVVRREYWPGESFWEVWTSGPADGYCTTSCFTNYDDVEREVRLTETRTVCTVTGSSYTKAQKNIAERLLCRCCNLRPTEWMGAEC